MTRIVCVDVTVQDRIYSLPTLSEGSGKCQANHCLEIGSDPAAVAAVVIAKFGVEVDLVSRISDDNCGNTSLAGLEGWGVNTTSCRRYPNARSSQSAILVDQYGKRIVVSYPSPDPGTDAEWLGTIDLSRCDLILAGVCRHGGIEETFSLARLADTTTLLDADMAPQDTSPLVALADHAVFLTPRLKRMADLQSLEEGLFQATTQTVGRVYITLGFEESLWTEDGHLCRREAFSVNMVDTTGTSDVFYDTFTATLARKMPTKEAIRFVSTVATMKYTQPGGRAGIPDRKQAESFLSPYA